MAYIEPSTPAAARSHTIGCWNLPTTPTRGRGLAAGRMRNGSSAVKAELLRGPLATSRALRRPQGYRGRRSTALGSVSLRGLRVRLASFLEAVKGGGVVGLVTGVAMAAVSAQAAPPPPKLRAIELGTAPPVELVRDGCGRGWHRSR